MIEIESLAVDIHGAPILHDVSLRIVQGEVFGLVGESGSGKSMTALALMGLLPDGATARGAVRLDGANLLEKSEAGWCAMRGNDIAMIFQEPMTALNPVQTIGAQVVETLTIHGATDRRAALKIARDRLDRVGLSHIGLDAYPHELSGGQRQRVCIAAAIALHPRLLIADEPTTALDVTTQAQILDLLRDLVAEENMGLLLITHDLAVVSGMADRIAVMRKGEIVETGPTAEVLTERRHAYTRALLAASAHAPDRAGRAPARGPAGGGKGRADLSRPARGFPARPAGAGRRRRLLHPQRGRVPRPRRRERLRQVHAYPRDPWPRPGAGGRYQAFRTVHRAADAPCAPRRDPGRVPGPLWQLQSPLAGRPARGRTLPPARQAPHRLRPPRPRGRGVVRRPSLPPTTWRNTRTSFPAGSVSASPSPAR